MSDLTYALAEEIGDPDLFVGREQEMARLMNWAAGTKRLISKSMGILSRRKKGKTALLENAPTAAWVFAQEAAHRISKLNDVCIIQILDEFQYMNKWIVSDAEPERVELLCHSYIGAAESTRVRPPFSE